MLEYFYLQFLTIAFEKHYYDILMHEIKNDEESNENTVHL